MPFDDVEILRAACCIAAADGEVAERERRAIEVLADRAGVGSASLQAMIDAGGDKRFIEDQLDFIRRDPEEVIATLWQVGAIDGKLGSNEKRVLRYFARKMGMSDDQYEATLDRLKERFKKRATS